MTKIYKRRALLLLLPLMLLGCVNPIWAPREILLSYSELGDRLAKRFPLERSVAGLVDFTFTDPRFAPREETGRDLRMAATCDLKVKMSLSSKVLNGSITISGVPRYDIAKRAVFLADSRIDGLRVTDLPPALREALTRSASNIVRDLLQERPLYAFRDEDLSRFGLRFEPQRIEVRPTGIALVTAR